MTLPARIADWRAYVKDHAAREADERRRAEMMAMLDDAERLLFDEHWTTDDPWPGIIYKRGGEGPIARVPVETWVMMRAMVRGMGETLMRSKKVAI